jgi:hypothetical protein
MRQYSVPNPDNFHLDCPSDFDTLNLTIYNSNRKTSISKKYESAAKRINLAKIVDLKVYYEISKIEYSFSKDNKIVTLDKTEDSMKDIGVYERKIACSRFMFHPEKLLRYLNPQHIPLQRHTYIRASCPPIQGQLYRNLPIFKIWNNYFEINFRERNQNKEKGIDLAQKALQFYNEGIPKPRKIIFISSDADIQPAVEFLISKNVEVEVYGNYGDTSENYREFLENRFNDLNKCYRPLGFYDLRIYWSPYFTECLSYQEMSADECHGMLCRNIIRLCGHCQFTINWQKNVKIAFETEAEVKKHKDMIDNLFQKKSKIIRFKPKIPKVSVNQDESFDKIDENEDLFKICENCPE